MYQTLNYLPLTSMFTPERIKACVDAARVTVEAQGQKQSRFYEQDFWARWFGKYRKPFYPDPSGVRGLEDLWLHYGLHRGSNELKAELFAEWVRALELGQMSDAESVIGRITAIQARQAKAYAAGIEKGIRYTFMDAFHCLARELDELMPS